MPIEHRGSPTIGEDDEIDERGSLSEEGSRRGSITSFRKQPARMIKDRIYDRLIDGKWHSARELSDLAGGVEFLIALADLTRLGYQINRNKNSYTLLSRWPTPPSRKTNPATIDAKIKELTDNVDYTGEEDLNFVRLGSENEDGDRDNLDLSSDEDSEDGSSKNERPFDDEEDPSSYSFAPRTEDPTPTERDDTLVVGENVGLPARLYVTCKAAILAKSGAGKTSAAIVMAEELARLELPFVVLDPMGVWWGLRAPADPELQGWPVLVLGGDHGDIPIGFTQGAKVADLAIKRYPLSTVVDMSNMTPEEQHIFVADFASTLYARNRRPFHLFIDEADEFAPQKPEGQAQKTVLGVIDRLVRRGRLRGIGTTLITQRSAVLHKNVLSQTDMLIAMCSVSPPDLRAIHDWLERSVTSHERNECLRALPTLPVGGAYILASGRLNIFKQIRFRKKETFDASATPDFEDEDSISEPEMAEVPDLDDVISYMKVSPAEESDEDDNDLPDGTHGDDEDESDEDDNEKDE